MGFFSAATDCSDPIYAKRSMQGKIALGQRVHDEARVVVAQGGGGAAAPGGAEGWGITPGA